MAAALRLAWEDPRVRAGMWRLLERRSELLDGGAKPLGWKLAFGAPEAYELLGIDGPLVGFLTDATLLACGDACAVGAWTAPKLEPEIAIHVGAPLEAGAGAEAAAAAISGVSAAIELADVDAPPSRLEAVLSGDIYHRRVVLGDRIYAGLPTGPIAVEVQRDGEQLAATADAEAAVGRLPELIAYVARYLTEFGAALRPGEVVISGSTVPLIDVGPGERVRSEVVGVGAVEVALS